jgi:hypothetical protein
VNSDHNPQQQKQLSLIKRRSVTFGVILLIMCLFLILPLFNRSKVEDVSLPTLVSALEAGQVATLTVRGDTLLATQIDGTQLRSR